MRQQKVKKFEDFLEAGAHKIGAAATFLYDLAKYREAFDSDVYRKGYEHFKIESECERFLDGMTQVFGKDVRKVRKAIEEYLKKK